MKDDLYAINASLDGMKNECSNGDVEKEKAWLVTDFWEGINPES